MTSTATTGPGGGGSPRSGGRSTGRGPMSSTTRASSATRGCATKSWTGRWTSSFRSWRTRRARERAGPRRLARSGTGGSGRWTSPAGWARVVARLAAPEVGVGAPTSDPPTWRREDGHAFAGPIVHEAGPPGVPARRRAGGRRVVAGGVVPGAGGRGGGAGRGREVVRQGPGVYRLLPGRG